MNILGLIIPFLLVGVQKAAGFNCDNYTRDVPGIKAYKLNVVCRPAVVRVVMNACALKNDSYNPLLGIGITNESVQQNYLDNACQPTDIGRNRIRFRLNLTDCQSTLSETKDQRIHTFTIRNLVSSSTTRLSLRPLRLNFTCRYNKTVQSRIRMGAKSNSANKTLVRLPTQNGAYSVLAAVFTDHTFLVPLPPERGERYTVRVGEFSYLGMTIDTDDAYVALQASDCWATPDANPRNTERFDILINGCPPSDSSRMGMVRLYKNFASLTVEVAFRTFSWTESRSTFFVQQLFLHCSVTICDWVLDPKCTEKSCTSYKPLFSPISRDRKTSWKDIKEIVSTGPIDIKTRKTVCDRKNGGCSHFCTIDNFGRKVCLCPTRWTLSWDQRRCVAPRRDSRSPDIFPHPISPKLQSVEWNHVSTSFGLLWGGIFLVVMTLSACLVIFYVRRRTTSRDKGRFNL